MCVCAQVLAEMDPDDILAKQVEQLEKEKRELQDKLKAQEKKVGLLAYLLTYLVYGSFCLKSTRK